MRPATERVQELTLAQALDIAEGMPEGPEGSSRNAEHGFAGAAFPDALRMAREGYPEGARRLRHAVGAMAAIREARRPQARWGPSGSAVDIGRYLSGEPDSMIDTVRAARPSPMVRIGVERVVSGATSTRDIEATGASVLFVVDALRTAGVPAEIWATFTVGQLPGGSSGEVLSTRVRVQDAGRPIDLERLAFWMMHPAALRRIAFGLWEHEPESVRRAYGFVEYGGYGYALRGRELSGDYDEQAPATMHEATAWVRDVLRRRIGVEVRDGWEGEL